METAVLPNAPEFFPIDTTPVPFDITAWPIAIESVAAIIPPFPIPMDEEVDRPAFALSPYQIPSVPGEVGNFDGVAKLSKMTGTQDAPSADEHEISLAVITSNVGTAGGPLVGPRKKVFADWTANDPVRVPIPVTGLPVTENTEAGNDKPTLVTLLPLLATVILFTPGVILIPLPALIPKSSVEITGSIELIVLIRFGKGFDCATIAIIKAGIANNNARIAKGDHDDVVALPNRVAIFSPNLIHLIK